MHRKSNHCSFAAAVAVMMAGLLAWPATSLALLGGLSTTTTTTSSTVVGSASAAQASVLGFLGTVSTTTLSSTGTLADINGERYAGQVTGSVPGVLTGEVLNAVTYSYSDQVDSEASLANLGMTVAGIGISADLVMAQASQVLGAAGSGRSYIDNLSINGVPIGVTGAPNQTVAIPGGQMVINEQQVSASGITVNAVHVIVNGVADVVIASATAGIS